MAKKRTAAQRKADTEAVAEDAAEMVEHKGPQGSAIETVKRDLDIFRAYLRGVDVYDLSVTYLLGPAQITNIVNRQKLESQRLSDTNPLDVIQEWIMKNQAGISELAGLGARAKGSARVSAISLRLQREDKLLDVLQSIGLIPHDLADVAIQLNGIQLANRMLDLLENRGLLTPELLEDISDEFKGTTIEGTATEVSAA